MLDKCFYLVVKCFWCCWFRMRSRNTKMFWGILSRIYYQSPQYLFYVACTQAPHPDALCTQARSLLTQAIFYALNLNTLCGCNPEIYYKKCFFCAPYIVLSKTSYTLVRANLWTDKNLKNPPFNYTRGTRFERQRILQSGTEFAQFRVNKLHQWNICPLKNWSRHV